MNWKEFKDLARRVMSEHFKVELEEKKPSGFPKRWDMVSRDRSTVGHSVYMTLVHGKRTPPAKFARIAEHVWLLEKLDPPHSFLVFGNQQEVPKSWLEKYGHLTGKVEFYFLRDDGDLEKLR